MRRGRFFSLLLLAGMVVLVWMFLTGCSSREVIVGRNYEPANVFAEVPVLPPDLKRVAVLPLTWGANDLLSRDGMEVMEPMLHRELTRAGRFEVVPVSEEALLLWSGQRRWGAEEVLPADLLEVVRARTGCDAVLFGHLSRYDPYPPLTIGWRLKLVDAREPRIWWAVDEVFDAGRPEVVNGARRYYLQFLRDQPPLTDSRSILRATREFGQYATHTLVKTLPRRY